MDPAALWAFLPKGYLLTVALETPVLLLGLSRRHPVGRRLFAGLWLTACTYPVVVLVLPILIPPSRSLAAYLLVAETFAPGAECALFAAAFHGAEPGSGQRPDRQSRWRDFAAITLANLFSFGLGELFARLGWLTA